MRRLLRPLWFAVAILFLVEEWLWSVLSALIRRAIDALGIPRLRERLAAAILRLPPPAALLLFLVPGLVLLPVKLLGLSLLAHGHWLWALVLLGGAKVLGAGVTAFIFQATRPRLLEMAWFRWSYGKVMQLLTWAHRKVDPFKERVRAWRRAVMAPLAARVRTAWEAWKARPRGRLMRRLLKLRRRVQRPDLSRKA